MVILMLLVGLVVLSVGAELLVRSASRLAAAVGISPLVVGLTVVAFGTSAPELVVSVQSAAAGQPDVAIGNVVGSNILNVLLILGLSAMIVPLRVSQQLVRIEVPLMVCLSFVLLLLAWDGNVSRIDGLMLATGLVVYTVWAIVKSRREQAAIQAEYAAEFGVSEGELTARGIAWNAVLLVVGLALLILGARWFIESAVTIARQLNVSELVIGLTIVAAGTSLPEIATSILAAIRGERDIAVGSVVGSNIFNIMAVLGISSLTSASGIAVSNAALTLDIPIMIAVAVACLPVFFTGHLIARWEGAVFFGYYCVYTVYVILTAIQSESARTFTTVMAWFVIPLTVITMVIGVVRAVRQNKATAANVESGDQSA